MGEDGSDGTADVEDSKGAEVEADWLVWRLKDGAAEWISIDNSELDAEERDESGVIGSESEVG